MCAERADGRDQGTDQADEIAEERDGLDDGETSSSEGGNRSGKGEHKAHLSNYIGDGDIEGDAGKPDDPVLPVVCVQVGGVDALHDPEEDWLKGREERQIVPYVERQRTNHLQTVLGLRDQGR